jgi:hemerythrin-like domain-containing protein
MKATELLMQEHRLIERVLDALELAADAVRRGGMVPPQFFLDATDFLSGFADGCHHRKEEGVLFRAMIAGGSHSSDGAIALMTLEHEEGRAYTRSLRDAARAMDRDPAARTLVVRNARHYIELLRAHIEKEDQMLFPLAADMIPSDRHEQVYADCLRVDDKDAQGDTRTRYAALAERLEREVAALPPPASGGAGAPA